MVDFAGKPRIELSILWRHLWGRNADFEMEPRRQLKPALAGGGLVLVV